VQHTVVHADGTAERIADALAPAPGQGTPTAPAALREEAGRPYQARSSVAGRPDPTTVAPASSVRPPSVTTATVAEAGGAMSPGSAHGGGGPAPDLIEAVTEQAPPETMTRRLPLGTFVHARSGDKGGDANIGLWVDQSICAEERIAWLTKFVTPRRVRELVPEVEDLPVEVHPLPNLGAVNVVIRGLLGDGVAASTRFDPQAKALGEWMRSRLVNVTEGLL
jgi:hypothetical protein